MTAVAIVGGTGYTGAELIRLLAAHPEFELAAVTARADAGSAVSDYWPQLRGYTDLSFVPPDIGRLREADLVFYATPNGTAMETVPALLEAGVRVVDLSADFRLRSSVDWERWYGLEHACPALLAEAVYGLPEVNAAAVASARLVANPGCYPTATLLGLLPLVEAGAVDCGNLVADTKSGVSGAGRKLAPGSLAAEVMENFHAYGVSGHRHQPEIEQALIAAGADGLRLDFVPHLLPMIRGIHATLYATLTDPGLDVQGLFEHRYAGCPFVDVMAAGSHPETRSVYLSNTCRLSIHYNAATNRVIVLSVIDNLTKGAAGQAIQNANLMFALPETAGLSPK
ncbi:MAG: N-acetyl-gamma-glutamyl-phosphate reductase [Gammaproteobacteria bacterium]|nr:N-acetyl-gamma-glutamyl-phosphate reductase [Gammaproteobacteria bacterium]NNM01842.1 N-acetyl-gamma-glutamyl-phosphate reductase [Gammaproteobacteria bacterium]